MNPLFGEYICKLDPKGRFLFPVGMLRQIPEDERNEFVINKGPDNCLVLFPIRIWHQELKRIYSLNQNIKKNRDYTRRFNHGAAPVTLDNNNRLLVSKNLLAVAGIDKEIVLFGANDRIEIWDRQQYEAWQSDGSLDMAVLTEEVLGNITNDSD